MNTDHYAVAQAVLLSLDTAKAKSGASILRPESAKGPRLVTSSVVTKQSERDAFVQGAKEMASALKLPLIVVAEEWDPPRGAGANRVDKRWNYKTILGMGEGWGKWTAEFERHDIHPLDVVRVTPNLWRDQLFGKNREKDSEKLKALAVKYVERCLKATLPPDAAEASCIGLWGIHSVEVHRRTGIWFRKNHRIP